MMTRGWGKPLAFLFAAGLFNSMSGDEWRGVLVKKGTRTELITDLGQVYPAQGNIIKEDQLNRQVMVWGRPVIQKKNRATTIQGVVVTKVSLYDDKATGKADSMVAKGHPYARTTKSLPVDELKPGARIEMSLPELGNSAASGGKSPVGIMVSLPANYRRDREHPVIIHFGGGMGGSGQASRWRRISGTEDFIIVGADYNFAENQRKGLIKIGTCRDFDSKIALTAIQILYNSTRIDTDTVILTGMSSGAYSITDNLKNPKAWKPFDGYCVIAGGSNTASAQIGSRPILFVMGQKDTLRHGWMNSAVNALKKANPEKLTVEMIPNAGHEWNKAMDEAIAKWLKREFVQAGVVERLNELLKNNEYSAAAVCFRQWLKEYQSGEQ